MIAPSSVLCSWYVQGQIAKHVFEALRPAALQDILQVIQSSHPTQQDIVSEPITVMNNANSDCL